MVADVTRIAFAQREYRTAPAVEDTSVLAKHPLALELEYNTLLRAEADAITFGQYVLALRKVDRWTWACFVNKVNYPTIEVGDTLNIVYPRFGLQNGKNFILKRIKRDAGSLFDELTLFGPEESSPYYGYALAFDFKSKIYRVGEFVGGGPIRRNLVQQSQTFDDNAYWNKNNVTVTANAAVAPDGTTTADKLIRNVTTLTHHINAAYSLYGSCVVSLYAKPAGTNYVAIGMTNNGGYITLCQFNLATGTVGNMYAAGGMPAGVIGSIEPAANGYYRCSVVFRLNDLSNTSGISIYASAGGDPIFESVAGNGVDGILVWGAQLEAGTLLTPYIPTTSAPVSVGGLLSLPGFSYTGTGVRGEFTSTKEIEYFGSDLPPITTGLGYYSRPPLTNYIPWSIDFEQWPSFGYANITSNVAPAPDGTMTADRMFDNRVAGQNPGRYTQGIMGNGVAGVVSIYAKAGTAPRLGIRSYTGISYVARATFDLTTGTIVNNTAGSASIESVGNGWYRCSIYAAPPAGEDFALSSCTIETLEAGRVVQDNYTATGTGYIELWQAQLVASKTPGPIIITKGPALAAIGAADMSQNVSIADQDFIIEVRALFPPLGTAVNNSLAILFDPLSINGRVILVVHGSGSASLFGDGNAQTNFINPTVPLAGNIASMIARRKSGKWILAVRSGGITEMTSEATWAFASTATAFRVGTGFAQFDSAIQFAGIKLGTFTDADLAARLLLLEAM